MLSRHLGPLGEFVVECEEQVGGVVGPIFIKHLVEVQFGILEVLPLEHEGTQDQPHFFVNIASQVDDLEQELLSLNLLVVFQAEKGVLEPTVVVGGVIN